MLCLAPRRVFTIALAVFASGCLDFDQYAEGTGGTGGTSIGGAPEGGAGGGTTQCPSDPVVPAAVCITGSVYDFDGNFSADWARTELGTVGLGCGGTCAAITLAAGVERLDLRTVQAALVDDCFASIDLLSTDAQRTFLELVPDGADEGGAIPLPDRASNIEVALSGNTVRFEVGEMSIPALTLDAGVTVDQLRIQVRADSIVLEAFAAGAQVACSEQPRPDAILSQQLRAGIGIQGSADQQASFDNFGALTD